MMLRPRSVWVLGTAWFGTAWLGTVWLGAATGDLAAQAPGASTFEAKVTAALARSRPILLRNLGGAHGGELALLCLAAVHDAVPPDDKVFARAMQKLARTRLSATYDVALRLMVAARFPGLPDRRKLAADDLRRLLRNITNDGGFDYGPQPRRWDLSNSQYGALGLRAAVELGGEVPGEVWGKLLQATLSAQGESGGFGYMAGGRDANVSMTAAGIVVARICADHLDRKTVAGTGLDRRLIRAWDFLAEHKGQIGDRHTKNSFYFHYGLERACILCDRKDVDGKDWYRSGGEMLLRAQLPRGGWRSTVDHIRGGPDPDGSDSVSTSFAILFLRRKFKKTSGPITPRSAVAIGQLEATASPAQVEAAVKEAVSIGRPAMPAVLRGLRSPIKPRRVAAAKAMIAITGEDFGFNPHLPPERSRAAATKAERWWLKSGAGPAKVDKQ